MAIAFAQVKYLSRRKALQATAAAAYRSCSKIYDERTGITFDYTKKKSPLLYSEMRMLIQNLKIENISGIKLNMLKHEPIRKLQKK